MAFDQAHADTLRELDEVKAQLDHATKSIGYLTDILAAIRDIAYRAGSGDAARDALEAIHGRASRAVGKGN
jgi:hypothetical protein